MVVEPAPVDPAPAVVAPVVEPAPVVPAPVVPDPGPRPDPEVPRPAPAPRPSGKAGSLVTVGELAAYLNQDPRWRPGSDRATFAGSGYLPGWTADGPPPAASPGSPATGVTAELARALCKSRGRDLPAFEPGLPDLEFRLADGVVVVADGDRHVAANPSKGMRGVEFRCTR